MYTSLVVLFQGCQKADGSRLKPTNERKVVTLIDDIDIQEGGTLTGQGSNTPVHNQTVEDITNSTFSEM